MQSIKNVLPIYTQQGLQVDNALLDGEFVPLCTDLLTLVINTKGVIPDPDKQDPNLRD